jgi:hypothetical protein
MTSNLSVIVRETCSFIFYGQLQEINPTLYTCRIHKSAYIPVNNLLSTLITQLINTKVELNCYC